jgi:hypothetical protein
MLHSEVEQPLSSTITSGQETEDSIRDAAIYSPSSESKSWDSGVCSISEVK